MMRTDYAVWPRRKNKKENIKEGWIVCASSWAGFSSGGCTAIIGDAFKHRYSSGCTYYTYRGACIMTNERAHEKDSSVGPLFSPCLLVCYLVGISLLLYCNHLDTTLVTRTCWHNLFLCLIIRKD